MKRSASLFWILIVICGFACTPPPPEIEPIPEPNLDRLDDVARRQIEGRRAALESALSKSGEEEKLASAYGNLGRYYLIYEFNDAAVAALAGAERFAPDAHDWPYYAGLAHHGAGRVAEAGESFARALKVRGEDLPTLLWSARCALETERPDEAAAYYQQALTLNPQNATALWGLGRIAQMQDRPEEAVEKLESAVREQPQADAVYHSLAMARRDLGDLDGARAALEKAGEARPVFHDPLRDKLRESATGVGYLIRLGADAQRAGRSEEAREHFQRAVESAPDNATARHNLGALLGVLGDHASAVEHLRRAAELDPKNRDAHFDLATGLSRVGDLEGALRHFEKVLEIDPQDEVAAQRRDLVRQALGR